MDYDRWDALLHHIFKQTQGDAWFRNEPDISSGVALRVADGEYRIFPYETPSLEPFEDAVKKLNPVVAVKVRSASVHAAIAETPPDATSLYVDAQTRIQILETMSWLPLADKDQSAAFIRDERVLVVWTQDLDTIIPTCADFEDRLIKLLWRSRPQMGSHSTGTGSLPEPATSSHGHSGTASVYSASLIGHSVGTPPEQAPPEATSPLMKRTWYGKKVPVTIPQPDRRKTKLYAPVYNGIAAGLAFVFMGNGVKVLLQEFLLGGDFMRFILVVTLPFLYCVSLFFALQIIQNVSMAIGPIDQFNQNSKYYSAIPPLPNPAIDNNLPHITIQMPVYKESLNLVLTPSIMTLKAAMQVYARQGGTSSIFVNDDGLRLLPPGDRDERISFYATHDIAWVARPRHGAPPAGYSEDSEKSKGSSKGINYERRGRFKKASNMNYALQLSLKVEKHLDKLLASNPPPTTPLSPFTRQAFGGSGSGYSTPKGVSTPTGTLSARGNGSGSSKTLPNAPHTANKRHSMSSLYSSAATAGGGNYPYGPAASTPLRNEIRSSMYSQSTATVGNTGPSKGSNIGLKYLGRGGDEVVFPFTAERGGRPNSMPVNAFSRPTSWNDDGAYDPYSPYMSGHSQGGGSPPEPATSSMSLEDMALEAAMEEMFYEDPTRPLRKGDEEKGLNVAGGEGKWMPWAAGAKNMRIGELILLVDSDTVVPDNCLLQAAREFHESPNLGILQHESDVLYVAGHYFENGIGYFTRRINQCISISCANGEVAPFVGHNAFLRWKAIQDAAFIDPYDGREKIWSEENVSEDFDMAMRLLKGGWGIRWATYSNGGFKEGVSLTVDDELNRWQKYAYGCNELLFNPLIQWWRRGPISKRIRDFVWSSAPFHYKISMMSYMFSYYGIAAAMPIAIINYVLLGFMLPVDGFYMHSFEIWLATTVVFFGAGNVGYTLLEYRLGKKGLISGFLENIMWIPFFFFFFGGLSIPVSQAILAHVFSYDISWSATVKEVRKSNFFREIPKILKRFWLSLLVSWIVIFGIIILSTPLVPLGWRVDGTAWAVIFPLAVVAACHILFPIVLNPWLMVFSY